MKYFPLGYAREHVLAEHDPSILIVDETGFLKKGGKSVGVQRQYSGTVGRIENCQVGVFLALAGARGSALIDRELYWPKSWCEDEHRLRGMSVSEGVAGFATKPKLAQRMIERAHVAGLRPSWVLADEVYGSDNKTRRFLEARGQPYVLAVNGQQRLWQEARQQRVDGIAHQIPAQAWFSLRVADDAKGPRIYAWAAGRYGAPTETGLLRWLLIRRSVDAPQQYA